ncbi:MAG: 2,3-bisphosphoglycerate-dependent phosphoglycerate mutase [Alphaproteobacteria bacterium]|jgi:2,3-bisphosphoglycerate-dependent phosphoglycerate mutase
MVQTTVYLLRQAETVPEEGVENSEWELSSEGLLQARDVVFKMRDLGIDVIYSSPYKRGISTVKPFAHKMGLPILLEEGFRELNAVGEYLAPAEFQTLSKKMWADVTFSAEGGESIRECQLRFIAALNKVAKENAGKTILICTHGMPLGAALKVFDNAFGYDDWARVKMPDVFKLVSDGEAARWDKSYTF